MADIDQNIYLEEFKAQEDVSRASFNKRWQYINDNGLNKNHKTSKAHFELWQPDTEYGLLATVRTEGIASFGVFVCVQAGTSGTAEPYATGVGDIVTDNTCKWELNQIGALSVRLHGDLSGRDLPNQHAMSAITGLVDTLSDINTVIEKLHWIVVPDIAARNALPDKFDGMRVLVEDATADTTVTEGWALYVYSQSDALWVKIAEGESLDILLDWDNLENIPAYVVIKTAVFVGAQAVISYPDAGKAVQLTFLSASPTVGSITTTLQKASLSSFASGSPSWTVVGTSDLSIPINTSLMQFDITANNDISAEDVLRINVSAELEGMIFQVKIHNS